MADKPQLGVLDYRKSLAADLGFSLANVAFETITDRIGGVLQDVWLHPMACFDPKQFKGGYTALDLVHHRTLGVASHGA